MEIGQVLWEPLEGKPHPVSGIGEGLLKGVISKFNLRMSSISPGEEKGCSRQKTRPSQRPSDRTEHRPWENCLRRCDWGRERPGGAQGAKAGVFSMDQRVEALMGRQRNLALYQG